MRSIKLIYLWNNKLICESNNKKSDKNKTNKKEIKFIMPLISVIVPVYKVEKYLDRCIDSILAQTFKDFELIIIDDGSPDKCPEMCDNWAKKDNRIIVIHQKNMGVSAARNAGIKIARGQYFTFVDSDDWISENMIQLLFDLIKKYEADISICNFVKTDRKIDTTFKQKNQEKIYTQDEFMKIILKIHSNRTIHYPWGKLYKRKVINDKQYPVGIPNGEDVEGMFKAVIRSDKIVETTEIGYFYFENIESVTRKKFGKSLLNLGEIWGRIIKISEKQAPEYTEYVKYNFMRSDFTVLTDSILYGDKSTDELYKTELSKIYARLKNNKLKLLKGPMVFKRKILLIIVCCFYGILKKIKHRK